VLGRVRRVVFVYEALVRDENAFGLLLSYHRLEDDEFGDAGPSAFAARFCDFEREALSAFAAAGLPTDRHVLALGHALYTEFHDAGDTPRLLSQLRGASQRLLGAGFENVAVLAYGGRWIDADTGPRLVLEPGPPPLMRASLPSEPLRRCLALLARAAEAEQGEEEDGGFGPALYVDLEAAEAVGVQLKNSPTLLNAGGASFFRILVQPPTA
jgi:hypothetical protein